MNTAADALSRLEEQEKDPAIKTCNSDPAEIPDSSCGRTQGQKKGKELIQATDLDARIFLNPLATDEDYYENPDLTYPFMRSFQ